MAKRKEDHKEVEHEYVYTGPSSAPAMQPLEQKPVSPSPEFARSVALSVLGGTRGCYEPSCHFSDQMAERGFDVFEMEYVIRNGSPTEPGEYSEEHKDHKYTFRGNIDGTDFDAVFSISAEHDFIKSPLMRLITGCWKTQTGKRRKRF